MFLQYFNRMSCTHALCVPADVQNVSRLQTSNMRIQPSPDFINAVILRNNMCDTFTARRYIIKSN